MIKDFVIALSLANLCFVGAWFGLLVPIKPYNLFFIKSLPSPLVIVALLLDVLLLAAIFWVGATLARCSKHPFVLKAARWFFLLTLVIPLYGITYEFFGLSKIVHWCNRTTWGWGLVGLLFALCFYLLIRWYRFITTLMLRGVLILFPFVLVTFTHAAWSTVKYYKTPSLPEQKRVLPLTDSHESKPRILLLIFDALDQQKVFLDRHPTVDMSEIDRWRRQSIYATSAYPPADNTIISVPSYLTGRLVARMEQMGTDKLMFAFEDDEETMKDWHAQPNLFTMAHREGHNSAIVGWALPYCKLAVGGVTSCSWEQLYTVSAWETKNLFKSMYDHILKLFQPLQWRKEHRDAYLSILGATKEAISNPDLNLTWVHWPIPHWPYIYDRYRDDFAGLDHPLPSYLDNLELVDRTLEELRLIMENADQWDKTTIILTADHALKSTSRTYGKTDLRVPFLIKLAGEKKEVIYDAPLNTIVIHDLILALLRGDVTSSDGVVHWFDQHPWRSH